MKIKLNGKHEHAGQQYCPGDEIELSDDLAKWLIEIGKAVEAETKKGVKNHGK